MEDFKMNKKIVWIILGILICLLWFTLLSATIVGSGGSANVTTSADGKYVYIIGNQTGDFYRSEDFGQTFEKFDITKKKK